MNKKLPNIYHHDEVSKSTNKNSYYSFRDGREGNSTTNLENIQEEEIGKNFFEYFNKKVTITQKDGKIVTTRILSKRDNRILLQDGTYLEINQIAKIE